jgi:hypothetical protein
MLMHDLKPGMSFMREIGPFLWVYHYALLNTRLLNLLSDPPDGWPTLESVNL